MDDKNDIKGIGQEILKFPIQKIYTGHCTSDTAYGILKKCLGKKLEFFSTGSIIEIG
jgi:7,8-dihydropterin-6-yl-methyl-4-(beta-D-ribofuranosyl)aminobenzene 5'-phosphate synthase